MFKDKTKPSKHFLRAIELKKDILITQGQVRNHEKLASQPLPKAKQSKFDNLVYQVRRKLRALINELDELFEKKLTADEIKALVATEGGQNV